MSIERKHFTCLIAVGAVVWAILLFLDGVPVSGALIRPFSSAVTAVVIAWKLFDKWMWRWRVFRWWFVSIPDIQGTWKGTLASNWQRSGEAIRDQQVFFTVKQSYSSIRAQLFTAESASQTLVAAIAQEGEAFVLSSIYRNIPRILQRGSKSPMHFGAVRFELAGNPPYSMIGEYWTDRDTKGELVFEERTSTVAHNYSEALQLQYARIDRKTPLIEKVSELI